MSEMAMTLYRQRPLPPAHARVSVAVIRTCRVLPLSVGCGHSARTTPLRPFPEAHGRAHARMCPRAPGVGETEQEPGHGGEVVHVWARLSECPRPRLFPSPQTAPSSSRGGPGEPERRTAREWSSRPSTWSSSTPPAPPATRPPTAGFASETRRPTTWTGWTSVTSAISKWHREPPLRWGCVRKGWGRDPMSAEPSLAPVL